VTASFDLIVIGGGINGAGIARDAAGRGASVLLLEAGDLASGTSSKSTKLVHGGLRYLEHYEFALVSEALHEREILWRLAPHLIRPMRFVLPVSEDTRPSWMLRIGLVLYDWIGGRRSLPNADAIDLKRHAAGAPLRPGFKRAFEYSDLWVDDARLVVLNALDAKERGVQVRTRCPITSARRVGDQWLVGTPEGAFTGRALVNAAGPGADTVATLLGGPTSPMRRVRGSHIVVPRLFRHPYAYILQLPDERIVFALPYERDFTLIGTTDVDHEGPLDHIEASVDEVAYLCGAASRYFAKPVKASDVVWTYSGVRALVDDGSGRPEAATRGYQLPLSEPDEGAPLLSVYGGKITTYRHLAEEAVNKLAKRLPTLEGTGWTANEPLPGGDFPTDQQGEFIAALRKDYRFLSEAEAKRIARSYGTRARNWLGAARRRAELGRDFGAGLSEAEIEYLKREEWARTAEDVLWRRSKIGLHMKPPQRLAVAEFMGG